jgi:hypothetical protein
MIWRPGDARQIGLGPCHVERKGAELPGYQEAFGPMPTEPHRTLTFEHGGKALPALRYNLRWAPIERCAPLSAEQLAALREGRGRKKAEREEAAWRAQAPLFTTLAERQAEEKGQGQSRWSRDYR